MKTKKVLIHVGKAIVFLIKWAYYPIYFFGLLLWYVSRLLLALSYMLLLTPQPAIDIVKNLRR